MKIKLNIEIFQIFYNRNRWLLFVLGFFLLVTGMPVILTLPAIRDSFNFSATGQIGDTIGGLTAPIIGFVGAILVYLSFKEQINANRIQREALADEVNRYRQDRRYNSISHDIDVIREEIKSFRLPESELTDTHALFYYKEMFIKIEDPENLQTTIKEETFKNFYFLIASTDSVYNRITNSELEIDDKNSLLTKLIYLYTSKLAIYLLPIILHCEQKAINMDTILILNRTYMKIGTYIRNNPI